MNRLEGIRHNRANTIFGNVTVILIRKNGKNIDIIRLISMLDEILYLDKMPKLPTMKPKLCNMILLLV